MSSTKRVFLTFFACFVLLFSFVFPAFAVIDSAPVTFEFAVPNPSDNFDGYIICPTTDGEATLLAWDITPTITSSSGDFTLSSCDVNVHVTDHKLTVDFYSTVPEQTFIVTVYYITNGLSSYIQRLNTYFIEYGSALGSQVTNHNASFICPNYFKGVTRLTHDNYDLYNPSNSFTYDCVFSDDCSLLNELKNINISFIHLLSDLDLTNAQLSEAVTKLNDIFDSVSTIDGTLSEFVYYYWEEFTLNQLPEQFAAVCSRLDNIYRLLSKFEWGEITTGFSEDLVSEFDDVEGNINDHLDNPELESFFDGVQVDTSTGAFAFIWNLITSCFNSHPEVLGLVSTILAFGLIALILNR